jgi:hypothetical protein
MLFFSWAAAHVPGVPPFNPPHTTRAPSLAPRNFTPKPMSLLEAQASNAAKAIIDMAGSVIAVITETTQPVRLVAKYKPGEEGVPVGTAWGMLALGQV